MSLLCDERDQKYVGKFRKARKVTILDYNFDEDPAIEDTTSGVTKYKEARDYGACSLTHFRGPKVIRSENHLFFFNAQSTCIPCPGSV